MEWKKKKKTNKQTNSFIEPKYYQPNEFIAKWSDVWERMETEIPNVNRSEEIL